MDRFFLRTTVLLLSFFSFAYLGTTFLLQQKKQKTTADSLLHNDLITTNQQIIVKFKTEITSSEIKNLQKEFGLKRVKEIAPLRLKIYELPAGVKMRDVLKKMKKIAYIEYAEPNVKYKILKKK